MLIDRHILQKLDEAQFFLGLMHKTHDELLSATRFGDSVFTPEHILTVRTFQYFFSGFVSSWQCVGNYTKEKCKALNEMGKADALTWFQGLHKNRTLAAFKYLRDSDIHDETISPAMSHRYSVDPPTMERGLSISSSALQTIPRFAKHPEYVQILTECTILEVAEKSLRELGAVVAEGCERGFLAYVARKDPLPITVGLSLAEFLEIVRDSLDEFKRDQTMERNTGALLSLRRDDRYAALRRGTDGFALQIDLGIADRSQTVIDSVDDLPSVVNEIRKFLIGQ